MDFSSFISDLWNYPENIIMSSSEILIKFIKKGLVNKALSILRTRKNLDINSTDNDGNTPFLLACQFGYDSIIRFIVDNFPHCNLNVESNKYAFDVLHVVRYRNNSLVSLCNRMMPDTIRYIADRRPDYYLNVIDEYARRPALFAFVSWGMNHIIIHILNTRSDFNINLENCHGETLLLYACRKNNIEIIEHILDTRDDYDPNVCNIYKHTSKKIMNLFQYVDNCKKQFGCSSKYFISRKGNAYTLLLIAKNKPIYSNILKYCVIPKLFAS